MQIQVTKNKVILPDNYIVNKGEYHVNVLDFLFSEEYTNEMVKKAIFVSKDKSVEQVIINNKCHIPNEMLNIKNFELRVYAYEIENGELVLRYSPTYAVVYLRDGSYKSDTSSEETITPTQFEQFEQALNNGLNELEAGLEEVSNVDIDVSKSENTATVTITKKDGTTQSVEINDGTDGQDGKDGKDGQDGQDGKDGIDGKDGKDAKINGKNSIEIEAGNNITIDNTENGIRINSTGGSGGTSNYNDLSNKPKINNVELNGNKSLNDLGIQPKGNYLTSETDPTVPTYVKNITQANITSWNNKSDFSGSYNDLTNKPTIPNKTSDLTNDSGFITKLVNNLSNYYLKSETYTKTEVNNLIGQIASIQFQLVNELPLTGNSSYIYLVPSSNPTTQNIKDEYIWVNNAWEQIGSTDVDLSNYQTKIDSSHKLNSDLVDDTNQTNKFVTSTEKTTWNNKSNFSGSYNDLTDKPTIPNEVTESTVSGWGFTKNVGTITEITMNGSSKGTSGAVDLGTVITSHQDISGKENVSNKVTSLSSSSTDTQYPSAKCVYNLVNCKIYGIKRSLTTTSSEWHRTDDSIGLEANATKDGSVTYNDFDNIYPWSDIYTYNYDRTTGLETAKIGDANFKFDGTNGEVLTKIPEFYYRRYRDDDYEYIQISKYPIDGFIKSEEFSVGRYDSYYDGSQIHSYSGYCPEVNRNITSFRTLSQAVGTNFGQLDWRYFLLQILYLVEYADYNSQSKLGNGATGFRVSDNDKALVAENNTNRIIINTSGANSFDIGQQVSIDTSAAWNWSVARNRTITAKEAYSSGGVTGTAITFDGDPVNIALNNVLWTTGQKSGTCDGLGMKSGCYKTPKNACIYRGIENLFGNIYQFIDGINVKNYVAYVCYDPSKYEVDKFTGDYGAVGYTNANTSSTWAKKLGYDENNPLVSLTTETGGGDATNMCDYYYCNSGNRLAIVGGAFYVGTNAGMWCWNLNHSSSNTSFFFGSRLLRY